MTSQRELTIAIIILAGAIIFNGLCQHYEPSNADINGPYARFDKLLGQHQQKNSSGHWDNLGDMADGIPD